MLTGGSGSVMRTFAPRCFPTRRDEGDDVCGTLSSFLVRSVGCQCVAARWAWVGSRAPLRMHDAGASGLVLATYSASAYSVLRDGALPAACTLWFRR